MPSRLDSLPLEIFWMIFDFLTPMDLLVAFGKIDGHVHDALCTYRGIQLNFQSMKKSSFNFLCGHIDGNSIRSIILSDGAESPGQIQSFLSRTRHLQFPHLRSVVAREFQDRLTLHSFLDRLEGSLSIETLDIGDHHQVRLKKGDCKSIAATLSTLSFLRRLTVTSSDILLELREPLPAVSHLTIESCALADLPIIYQSMVNLVYVNLTVPWNTRKDTPAATASRVRCLKVKSNSWMLFSEVENLLAMHPLVERLVLETKGEGALLEADRWETLIKTRLQYLKRIDLNIHPSENDLAVDLILIPFRNTFWARDKRCSMVSFVSTSTWMCGRLFSAPYFTPSECCTLPYQGFIYQSAFPYELADHCQHLHVTELLPSSTEIPQAPFKHVDILSLESENIDVGQLLQRVHVSSVRHLQVGKQVHSFGFVPLFANARHIQQLTIFPEALIHMIDAFTNAQEVCGQIRKLCVEGSSDQIDLERLCHVFGQLQHISLYIVDRNDILRLIAGLAHLVSGTFKCTDQHATQAHVSKEWLEEKQLGVDGTCFSSYRSLALWID